MGKLAILIIIALVTLTVGGFLAVYYGGGGNLVLTAQVSSEHNDDVKNIYLTFGSITIHEPGNEFQPWGGNSAIMDLWREIKQPQGPVNLIERRDGSMNLSVTFLPVGTYTELYINIKEAYWTDGNGNKHMLEIPQDYNLNYKVHIEGGRQLKLHGTGQIEDTLKHPDGVDVYAGKTSIVIINFDIDNNELHSGVFNANITATVQHS